MRIILISPPDNVEHETSLVNSMFEEGLTLFHLRKPGYNRKRLSVYLNRINLEFHSRIVVHSCFGLLTDYNLRGIHIRAEDKVSKESFIERYKKDDLSISISCHAFDELTENTGNVDYAGVLQALINERATWNQITGNKYARLIPVVSAHM